MGKFLLLIIMLLFVVSCERRGRAALPTSLNEEVVYCEEVQLVELEGKLTGLHEVTLLKTYEEGSDAVRYEVRIKGLTKNQIRKRRRSKYGSDMHSVRTRDGITVEYYDLSHAPKKLVSKMKCTILYVYWETDLQIPNDMFPLEKR